MTDFVYLLPFVGRISNQTCNSGSGGQQSRAVDLGVVNQSSEDSHRTNGSTTTPYTTVETSRSEQSQRMSELGLRVGYAVDVTDIVDQNCTHDGVGSLLVHDFHGLKVVHASVGSGELDVRDDRSGGSGRSDVGGNSITAGTGNLDMIKTENNLFHIQWLSSVACA